MKLFRVIEPFKKIKIRRAALTFIVYRQIILSMLLCLLTFRFYDACLVATGRKEIYIGGVHVLY